MMSVEKMYCNESQKSLGQQLLFEVSVFRFQLHFSMTFIMMDIQ